ncbi:MAG: HEAT repeat domain-containing protein [Candidatus Eisenbacteria bacterium]|nr:HEAT repeat domain-containing protein [Candidatus Eisenbacteria bacterium]
MALKASESFIRYVTMGAASAHRAVELLNQRGHDVRELERYATCNKIWQTKIKRLRMPDLSCLRCGRRFEVRAKTKLEIKMSDSPTVAGREWDAGLRDEDVVIFVRCDGQATPPTPAEQIAGFEVGQLRACVDRSRLGPPKSAGEGAERDRTWPAIVPSSSGHVLFVGDEKISLRLDTGRQQTFQLRRRGAELLTPYVGVGERIQGEVQFLAGAPARPASLDCSGGAWDPVRGLTENDTMNRFSAVKAAGLLQRADAADALLTIAHTDPDQRVRLEAAGSLLRLSHPGAADAVLVHFDAPERPDLRMESVLLVGEVRTTAAKSLLETMLGRLVVGTEEELRAAIIWSLGLCGAGDVIVPYLSDPSDSVAGHAAVALGAPLSSSIRARLIAVLASGDTRAVASAAWVLTRDGTDVVGPLLEASQDPTVRGWVVSILGRRSPAEISPRLEAYPEIGQLVAPWWNLWPGSNWSSAPEGVRVLQDLAQQEIFQAI